MEYVEMFREKESGEIDYRRRLREDTALHLQSSVRLHKYCVHG